MPLGSGTFVAVAAAAELSSKGAAVLVTWSGSVSVVTGVEDGVDATASDVSVSTKVSPGSTVTLA